MANQPTKTERPPITSEELSEFFTDRHVKGECPSCGANKWMTMVPHTDGNLDGVAFLSVDHRARAQYTSYVPTIALTCENCGYPRLFVWAVIEAWKNSREPKP